jgi:hypothetical protein
VSHASLHGSAQRCVVSRTAAMIASAPRISQCSNQPLPWETPSETLRYPHRAPRRFRADQVLPRARWWNRSTASKPSCTNIIKAAQGKRYWPHLLVHCLSRGGPMGHCWYPTDRVPRAQDLSLVPRHQTPHTAGKGFGVAACPRAPDPLPVPESSGIAMCPVAPGTPPDREGL